MIMNEITKGNLHLIGLGGCGTNVVVDLYEKINGLGDGFSNASCIFIDTTDKTIQAYPEYKEDNFFKVVSTSSTDNELDGTGGERKNKTNVMHMDKSVREFIDDSNLRNGKNDYYVIVASAGGGTGSTLSPLLLRAMLEKDFNVLTVIIGDSSNFLSLNNTINTLTSLQGVSVASKKCVSNIYYNNTFNGVTSPKTENDVNDKVFKMLSVISMFVSGSIQNIDHQDMINFFRPDKYASFRVAPGVYSLGVTIDALDDDSALLVRTVIKEDTKDIPVSITPLHNKVGTVTKDYDSFGTYPLFLTQRRGVLGMEVNYLKEELEKIERMKNSKYDAFDALDTADIDEFGLAL
jgi:hypothetical protein